MAKLVLDDSFLDSPSLRACSLDAEIHWTRIVSSSHDAYGCFRYNVRVIHAKAFPDPVRWAHITETMVGEWLREYTSAGMLQTWESDGRTWGYWLGWDRHNRIDTRFQRKTPVPPEYVPGSYPVITGDLLHPNPNPNPNSNPNPVTTCSRKRERARLPGNYSEEFSAFWKAYPKKVGKGEAWKQWQAHRPPIDATLAALSWQVRSDRWTDEGGKYIPDPERYIKKRRWEDEPVKPVASTPAAQAAPTTTERIESLRRRAAKIGGKAGESLLREATMLEEKC